MPWQGLFKLFPPIVKKPTLWHLPPEVSGQVGGRVQWYGCVLVCSLLRRGCQPWWHLPPHVGGQVGGRVQWHGCVLVCSLLRRGCQPWWHLPPEVSGQVGGCVQWQGLLESSLQAWRSPAMWHLPCNDSYRNTIPNRILSMREKAFYNVLLHAPLCWRAGGWLCAVAGFCLNVYL